MPALNTPRIARASMVRPLGSVTPGEANATFWPSFTFGAPHTTVCSVSPSNTVATDSRSAFSWGTSARTSPTITPSRLSACTNTLSTSNPIALRRRSSTAGELLKAGRISLIQFSEAFIRSA